MEVFMKRLSRRVIGCASSIAFFGFIIASGITLVAHRFVKEFSHSHVTLDQDQFTWDMPVGEAEPPGAFRRRLTMQTRDGIILQGEFWSQPHPVPTVILCHGYRVPIRHLQSVAALEYRSGYNILLFDFRGHGESARAVISGGNAEVYDLEAAVKTASQQPETLPGKLILHGFSMGASVALLLPPHPDVAAIIADSAYARLDTILQRLTHYQLSAESMSWHRFFHCLRGGIPAFCWAAVVVSRLVFRLRFGHALIARPDRSFKRWGTRSKAASHLCPRPILLIHCTHDSLIPLSHAHQLAAKARAHQVPIETYFVEHGSHCGAYGSNPERYVQRLQQFVALHIGDHYPFTS